jgi:hypothetical protein
MRFGYENLFDTVNAKFNLQRHCGSEYGYDEGVMTVPIGSYRRHALFLYSGFMSESEFLHGAEDQSSPVDHGLLSPSMIQFPLPMASKKRPIEPDRCIFVSSFDRLSEEDLHNLEGIYRKHKGKRPSKREVKLYSSVYEIPQCKIKRWFDAKLEMPDQRSDLFATHQVMVSQVPQEAVRPNYVPIYPKVDSDPEISSMLDELEENVNQMEELNTSIGNFISGLIK